MTRVLWCEGATQTSPMTVRVLSSWALPLATQSSCPRGEDTGTQRPLGEDSCCARPSVCMDPLAVLRCSKGELLVEDHKPSAHGDDRGIWCLCHLLNVDPDSVPPSAAAAASLPLSLEGLGLRSASRLRGAAHWASWADSLKRVFNRHPDVARRIVRGLEGIHAASLSREGFHPPPWEDLMLEEPEPSRNNAEPGQPRKGWQKRAIKQVDVRHLRHSVRPQLTDTAASLLRSQAGPMASAAITAIPSKKEFRLEPQPFHFLLLRRLRLPWPFSARSCRCGRPLESVATTVQHAGQQGFGGCRGWVLENVAARVCREAGGRVRVNVLVRDMDLHAFNQLDGRKLEVVVDGLPLWNGAQLALDTTMVSPVRSDGTARAGTASINGEASDVARTRKARRHPELSGEHARARLVVVGAEVGGRWSADAATFLCGLATAKARDAPFALGGSVSAAWLHRWQGMLGATASAFAESLLEGPATGGADGPTHSMNDVLGDACFG